MPPTEPFILNTWPGGRPVELHDTGDDLTGKRGIAFRQAKNGKVEILIEGYSFPIWFQPDLVTFL